MKKILLLAVCILSSYSLPLLAMGEKFKVNFTGKQYCQGSTPQAITKSTSPLWLHITTQYNIDIYKSDTFTSNNLIGKLAITTHDHTSPSTLAFVGLSSGARGSSFVSVNGTMLVSDGGLHINKLKGSVIMNGYVGDCFSVSKFTTTKL
jgi:hypothetical protein